MPKVDISAELLDRIAREIGRAAEALPLGTVERQLIENLLLNNDRMVSAFIRMHLDDPVMDGA